MLLWERKYAILDHIKITVTLVIAIQHTVCHQKSIKLIECIDFTITYLKNAFYHLFIH